MQILTIDKDKFVAVDGDQVTVYSRSELEKEKEHAEYNIEMCQRNLVEAQAKLVSTEKLDEKQREAVESFNLSLGLPIIEQEIASWQTKLIELKQWLTQ